MLNIFRVDLGETYKFETDLVLNDVKTLKSEIERQYKIPVQKQILIINGGDLLDDDDVQVCMKTRDTGAGTEENPIYLLDKSHLESARPIQISTKFDQIPIFDDRLTQQWTSMPATYETIVRRAEITSNYLRYAQLIVRSCDRLICDQQTQYQGWMAVIANTEDTLSGFLLNHKSFYQTYQSYLLERSNYLQLFESLPKTIEILHRLKLPSDLSPSIENSSISNPKSPNSSTVAILSTTSNSNYFSSIENCFSNNNFSLFQWITIQLGNMKIDEIIKNYRHIVLECNEDLLKSINKEIDDLSKKISSDQLKHLEGIEERFSDLQKRLVLAKRLQQEQKDCADCFLTDRQRFSSRVGNQNDLTLIKDVSIIHDEHLQKFAVRHKQLVDIEERFRKSKQEIINHLHRRFKNLMLLQRNLVDYDAKQSLYIHKLNRTRKGMAFLRQLEKTPNLYCLFIYEAFRRKQYSITFNKFSEMIYRHVKDIYHDEFSSRQRFIQEHEPHFLFNLLPGLKILPNFFINEPLPKLDTNLPEFTENQLDELFDEFPEILEKNKKEKSNDFSVLNEMINLFYVKHCSDDQSSKLNIETKRIDDQTRRDNISPSNSSRSTLVHSRSSSTSSQNDSNKDLTKQSQLTIESREETTLNCSTINLNENSNDDKSLKEENLVQQTNSSSNHVDEDDYIKCSLETVYTSPDINLLPIEENLNKQNRIDLRSEFVRLKNEYQTNQTIQHNLIIDYHQHLISIIKQIQQSNLTYQQEIQQYKSEIQNHLQDNEHFKMQLDINEQIKTDLINKFDLLKNEFDQFRKSADNETSQIMKAIQSDHEFELEKVRSEYQETIQRFKEEQNIKVNLTTISRESQTDKILKEDKQTESTSNCQNKNQFIQTESKKFIDQSSQFYLDENDRTTRTSNQQDQQKQFNLAIQRAVLNSTNELRKQIIDLEQQLNQKQTKIVKLKELVKKLQSFYTLSTTSPFNIELSQSSSIVTNNDQNINGILPDSSFTLNSSTDDEQSFRDQFDRTNFIKRSEPISMPSTFIAQSMLAAGNAVTSPKTEKPLSTTMSNLLMDSCFKDSPSEGSAAVELYTPFAASPPNSIGTMDSSQTPIAMSHLVHSPPIVSPISRSSSNNLPPQACPIAFFTVNRSDHVIIYYNTTYQHYMIYSYLPTLHFIHSDCYDLFHIQTKSGQSTNIDQVRANSNNQTVISSSLADNALSSSPSGFLNSSMINSTSTGTNGLNPSTTPLLGQVTDKEYCQAKKTNNRFNVPLGTKFYRVRVQPWKPSLSNIDN